MAQIIARRGSGLRLWRGGPCSARCTRRSGPARATVSKPATGRRAVNVSEPRVPHVVPRAHMYSGLHFRNIVSVL